jgi:hypothetical protein
MNNFTETTGGRTMAYSSLNKLALKNSARKSDAYVPSIVSADGQPDNDVALTFPQKVSQNKQASLDETALGIC